MKKTTAAYWAPSIIAESLKNVGGILNVGRQLIAAKEACEHGEFLRLFKGHEIAVSEPVPFTESTGRMLMAVARNEVISNREFVHDLPQSWGTLYELTKLDDEQIVAGIKAGDKRKSKASENYQKSIIVCDDAGEQWVERFCGSGEYCLDGRCTAAACG